MASVFKAWRGAEGKTIKILTLNFLLVLLAYALASYIRQAHKASLIADGMVNIGPNHIKLRHVIWQAATDVIYLLRPFEAFKVSNLRIVGLNAESRKTTLQH